VSVNSIIRFSGEEYDMEDVSFEVVRDETLRNVKIEGQNGVTFIELKDFLDIADKIREQEIGKG
jgi:hypothetical protein